MGFLRSFLDKKAILYNIDLTTLTPSGQPIEKLVQVKTNVPIFFSPHPSMIWKFVQAGGVKFGDFTSILETLVVNNQVLEIGGIKYRIVSAVEIKFKSRVYGYVAHLEFYKH